MTAGLPSRAAILFVCAFLRTLNAQDEISFDPITSWLDASAALRLRGDFDRFEILGSDEQRLGIFSRIRLGLRATPFTWLQFAVQLQDARTLSGPLEILRGSHDNHADALFAYADLGPSKDGLWRIRVGRQPLAFGDERLVGADTYWDNRVQRFDGVRVTLHWREWHWDLFSATPTTVSPDRFDRIIGPDKLTGIYSNWTHQNLVLEPYLLWDRGSAQPSNLITPGFRLALRMSERLDGVAETALQRGMAARVPVAAWAVYGELKYRLTEPKTSPLLVLSYSHASGDQNSHDNRLGTFNDLHPAGYNACGFAEPFAWRNIRDLRLGAEWPATKNWRITADAHAYWLATVKDGVYVDEGPSVDYDPLATSSHLGSRILVMTQRTLGAHMEASLGYARFFRADYLQRTKTLSNSLFASWTVHL